MSNNIKQKLEAGTKAALVIVVAIIAIIASIVLLGVFKISVIFLKIVLGIVIAVSAIIGIWYGLRYYFLKKGGPES